MKRAIESVTKGDGVHGKGDQGNFIIYQVAYYGNY